MTGCEIHSPVSRKEIILLYLICKVKTYRMGVWGYFSRFIRFGDGSKIRVLHDVWCGGQTFKVAFPKLFSISRFREASVANLL